MKTIKGFIRWYLFINQSNGIISREDWLESMNGKVL